MCMTHIGPNAPWWGSLHATNPWVHEPAYAGLIGFHVSMIVPDLLHVRNLGVARDVLGSALKTIMSERTIFDAGSVPDRLTLGTESLKHFARQHHLPLRLRKLSKSKLCWSTNKYPTLGCSGYDAYVVGKWLEHLLSFHQGTYPEIYTLLWSSNKAMSLQYHAARFLTQDEKLSLRTLGDVFLRTYLYMAGTAMEQHKMMWRVRPKFHMLCHNFSSPRLINQSVYATWCDEDFFKKCGKTLSLTSSRTAQKRLLERWMLQLRRNLARTLDA